MRGHAYSPVQTLQLIWLVWDYSSSSYAAPAETASCGAQTPSLYRLRDLWVRMVEITRQNSTSITSIRPLRIANGLRQEEPFFNPIPESAGTL